MSLINKLTPKQETLLVERYQEWLTIGRQTKPINQEKAKASIVAMYREIGEAEPAVLFFSSPIMCLLAYGVLRSSQLGSRLYSRLASQLDSQFYSQLRSQLRSQLYSQLDSQFYSQLRSQLYSQLRSQLYSQLYSQLGSQFYSQLRSQLGSQLYSQLYSQLGLHLSNRYGGNQWCAWEVFYKFCGEIGVNYTKKESSCLDLWIQQSRYCHWWFPYNGIVLASDHPRNIFIDDSGRLHAENKQAIEYSDGWGLNAWHGIRLPENIWQQKITLEKINNEHNAEVRRSLMEIYGMDNYLSDNYVNPVDKQNDRYNTPIELFKLPGSQLPILRVVNSSPEPDGSFKNYVLTATRDTSCAIDAVASLAGTTKQHYKPLIES